MKTRAIKQKSKESVIIVTPNYYPNHINAPRQHYLTEYEFDYFNLSSDIHYFDDAEDAQSWIDKTNDIDIYRCAHGEYARPDYDIINTDDMGLSCIDATDYHPGGDWEAIDRSVIDKLGLKFWCEEYDYAPDVAVEIYSEMQYLNGYEYMVCYAVKSLALQLCNDTSDIDWTGEACYRRRIEL